MNLLKEMMQFTSVRAVNGQRGWHPGRVHHVGLALPQAASQRGRMSKCQATSAAHAAHKIWVQYKNGYSQRNAHTG